MLQNGVNTKNQDDCWMNMAIKLASNGIGLTSPNPCVGAVIVHENQVIGSGFHKKAGLPHAEREAIADGVANGNAPLFADSTLYVTLEPCSTSGKTPPCTDAILKHRFKRVVYGSEDPNPKHRGAALIFLNRPASRLPAGSGEGMRSFNQGVQGEHAGRASLGNCKKRHVSGWPHFP